MSKEVKTNALRILDRQKISYSPHSYECGEFIDGVHIAEILGQSVEQVFKTLVTVGKSGAYYVFVVPVAMEMDMKKCAKAAGEKSLEMVHVKDITSLTGYVRGGVSPIGMKKQFKTFVHFTAEGQATIIVSGGRLGLQVELSPSDLLKACSGQYADITA